ncbi:UBX domain-containing protein 8 [Aplysia californica]|uniref:UBX domain-containing protein 8 n=1 Tax=Aplysia californica TaxID=6500 RepID=A0ABM0K2S9_APLCA|nr:UBX domain-containing protein 8 [Aplysia californica]
MDVAILKVSLQGLFVVVVTVLLLNWLASKLNKVFSKWNNTGDQETIPDYTNVVERYRQEKEDIVERLQKKQDEKAQDYMDRVLIPREEEKRKRKIEKCERFSGPAWKGEGYALGGNESESSGDDNEHMMSPGQRAARKRIVQECINQRVAAAASKPKEPVARRVIKLPEEPEGTGCNVVTIILRTPVGTTCQRKFFLENQVQNVLDFITTQGFSQNVYTIAMSYPRVLLNDPSAQLSTLNLGQRVLLNIEERD